MRKLIVVLVCSIGLLLLGYTAYRGYQVWREKHLMSMTKAYLAKSDTRNAMLSLQQLVHVNPRNVEATRLMAGVLEASRSPSAVAWRQRVLELNPKSFEDQMSLVKAALIFHNISVATNVIANMAEADRNSAPYHDLAGGLALFLGKPQQAEAHFTEAIRLDPANPLYKINLAKLHLHSSNALDMAEARIELKRIILNSTNAIINNLALRELILDALQFNDLPTALVFTQELTQQTNALFADALMRLEVLHKAKSPEFNPTLIRYQKEAVSAPANLTDLARWEMSRLSPAQTLAWLQTLPTTIRTNQPSALLMAECQLAMKDWKGMQDSLQSQNWGDLDYERHGLLAWSLQKQNLDSSKAEWQEALSATKNRLVALKTLLGIAQQLQWSNQADQILWIIVNFYPGDKNAWLTLRQNLIVTGRTRSLLQLTSIELGRNPSELWLKNDLALIALLLNADELKPHALALAAFNQDRTNASVASTYAFSLYLQGKPAEALKVMQQLKASQLADPGIAGYYGLVLKANGHKAEAISYLKLAVNSQLLPEERLLFTKAETDP